MIDMLLNPHMVQWLILLLRITLLLMVVRIACHLFRNRNPQWQILLLRAGVVLLVMLALFNSPRLGWGPRVGSPAHAQIFAELHSQPPINLQ